MMVQQIPNVLTVARIFLVVPVAIAIQEKAFETALWLFFVAGVTDAIDGFLARRFDWKSRFGSIADPLADKLLLVTSFVMLTLVGLIDHWLLWLVIGRDLFIVAGSLLLHAIVGRYEIRPTLLGKLSTVCQIVFVLVVVIHQANGALYGGLEEIGTWIVALVTILSGIHYGWVGGRRLAQGLGNKGC